MHGEGLGDLLQGGHQRVELRHDAGVAPHAGQFLVQQRL
jgi:hypothetical protein